MQKTTTFFILLLIVSFSSKAQQSDTATHMSLQQTRDAVYGFPQRINPNTSSASLSAAQASLTRPEKMTDELIYLPGVYLVPDGIGGQILNVRGFDQDQVNVYFNGIPLGSNMQNRLSMDGLFFANADLSVEEGAASLIYGANSSGNVIRLDNSILRPEKFGIKASTYFGNNGQQSYNAFVYGNVSKKFYYQVSANYFKRSSFALSKNFDTTVSQATHDRLNSDQENLELMATLTYAFNDKHRISLTVMNDGSTFGYPASLAAPRFRRMDYWNNTMIGLRHMSMLSNKLSLETNVYYTNLDDTLNQYATSAYAMVKSISHWNDQTLGARGILSYQLAPHHKLSFSADFKNDVHEQVWYTTATTKENIFISALEYQGQVFKVISLTGGISYNFMDPYATNVNQDVDRKDLSAVNYQVSAAYAPESAMYRVHLGYSRTTIFPNMSDTYGDALIGYVPNPGLGAEICNNVDAGISTQLIKNKLTAQLGIYTSNPLAELISNIKQ